MCSQERCRASTRREISVRKNVNDRVEGDALPLVKRIVTAPLAGVTSGRCNKWADFIGPFACRLNRGQGEPSSTKLRALHVDLGNFSRRLLQAEWQQRRRDRLPLNRKREIRASCVKKTQWDLSGGFHLAYLSVITG